TTSTIFSPQSVPPSAPSPSPTITRNYSSRCKRDSFPASEKHDERQPDRFEGTTVSCLCSRSDRFAIRLGTLDQSGFSFTGVLNESVVVAKLGPRAVGHFAEVDEFPVGHVGLVDPEVISNRG